MGHYLSNLRDIEFNLFEVFGGDSRLGHAPFGEIDPDTARAILDEVNRLATGPLAEPFADADRNPPVYDPATKTVTMPESFKKAYAALMESGWYSLDLPEALGGAGAPPSVKWAAWELLLGSQPAAFMYMSGPGFAAILHALGNEDQKRMAELMVENEWGSTMVLTEPDAGSDVGAGRTKAIDNGDGTWRIEGVKRFITSGEHDLSDNIIHLVLARPEGGKPGTKGLSLFVVPKFHFDLETGALGERNGVYATNVEKKMGLKASATCEMTFGDGEPAIGYLVGDVHDGIAQMFKVIEYARMMVGTKAIATLSTGYLNALEYAKTRVQGADLAQMADKTAPRVEILRHPDVRRSLMLQKTYAEGLRALVAYTAFWQDQVVAAEASGDEEALKSAEGMNDFLLPLVKGVGSERSYELLATSLQTFGGSGFLQDYPIEQYIRDAKIDTLYEGTTAIQGLDFFFRKIVKNNFAAITALSGEITATASPRDGEDVLAADRARLMTALNDVSAMVETMALWGFDAQNGSTEKVYLIGLNTTRLLMAAGDLIIGWLLVKQAEVALAALVAGADKSDEDFYRSKVASARWFAKNRLPLLSAERDILVTTDLEVMTMPDSEF